jgi:hypothetical protein
VLPSLWEQVNGSREENWAIRAADGTFVRWSDAMSFLWRAKDELPARGLVCVGKHVARVAACVAPRLVPLLVAANGAEPEEAELQVVEAIAAGDAITSPQLRQLTGLTKKETDRAIASLHRKLVLTNGFLADGGSSWGAIAHDLVERKWRVDRLAARDDARRELAAKVLRLAGELTAADLGGLFGWRRREAAALLDEVGQGRDEPGFRIWTPL